jgi:hypothetical protein
MWSSTRRASWRACALSGARSLYVKHTHIGKVKNYRHISQMKYVSFIVAKFENSMPRKRYHRRLYVYLHEIKLKMRELHLIAQGDYFRSSAFSCFQA